MTNAFNVMGTPEQIAKLEKLCYDDGLGVTVTERYAPGDVEMTMPSTSADAFIDHCEAISVKTVFVN